MACTFPVMGATVTWTNVSGGAWRDAANWDPNQVPGSGDHAVITAAGSYTVTVTGTRSVDRLTLGDGDGSPVLQLVGQSLYGSATLNVANTFTNRSTVELTSLHASYGATLNVSAGPLVNDSGALILASAGAGGARTVGAELDNRGAVTVRRALTLSKGGSVAHLNSGSILADGADLALTLTSDFFENSGSLTLTNGANLTVSSGSFTTTGSIDHWNGTLSVNGTTFNYVAGALDGTGTRSFNGGSLNLTPGFSNAEAELRLTSTTVNGPGALTNAPAASMTFRGVTCNADLVNEGDLVTHGTCNINADFTAPPGSTLKIEGITSYGTSTLTLANPFTNQGTIELTSLHASYGASLNVSSGSLVNDSGALILASAGAGGPRTLGVELDNHGTVTVRRALTLSKGGSVAHLNSGSILADGADLTLTLTSDFFENSGSLTLTNGANLTVSSGSFTTTGSIDHWNGTLSVNGTTFNYVAGALDGTGTRSFNGGSLNLTPDFSNSEAELRLTSTTVNGPGALTNAPAASMTFKGVTCNADLVNEGDLVTHGACNINSSFTASPGSTLKIEGITSYGTSTLTLANPFTNQGTIELTSLHASYGAGLNVSSGSLVNASGALILVSDGAGGPRTLGVELDNRGTVTIRRALTLSKGGSVAHLNSGSILADGADLALTLTGDTFGNSGSLTLTNGANLAIAGGAFTSTGSIDHGNGTLTAGSTTFNYDGGRLTGTGTRSFTSSMLNLTPSLSNVDAVLLLSSVTVNGPGTLTNAAAASLTLKGVTCNADLVNQGDLVTHGACNINSGFTALPGSTLKLEGIASYGTSTLAFANPFTNQGAIELTSLHTSYGANLNVSAGPLINASEALILVSAGSGGPRTLDVELDNRGIVTIRRALTLSKGGSVAHLNSGSILADGADLALTLTGDTFANAGSLTLTNGANLAISGGSFTTTGSIDHGPGNLTVTSTSFGYDAGTFAGTGTRAFSSSTLNLTPGLSNAEAQLLLLSSTVNGPGPLTNATAASMTFMGVTCNADLANQGTLVSRGSSSINGNFAALPGSILRLEGVTSYGTSVLTVANPFTNRGTIELSSARPSYGAALNVNGGALVNDAGGLLLVSAGAGGGRALGVEIVNRGTFTVEHAATMAKNGANHFNSGIISVNGGDFHVTQAGSAPTFTNTGTIDITAGRSLRMSAGQFSNTAPGVIRGNGILDLIGTNSGLSGNGAVAPGTSPGVLSLTGNYNPESGSLLGVELGGITAGPGHDLFAISGAANLDGTLDAMLVNGFAPAQYDSFNVVTCASLSSRFIATNLPSPHLYGWRVEYTNTSVGLTVVNTVPTFNPIANQEVDEETELAVDASARDTDVPTQALTYSLLSPPSGASIDSGTGAFSWTPTEVQGPGTNIITVRVVDDGSPNLSATNQFEVIVKEVNVVPIFDETPTNRTMDELTLLTVTNASSDVDIPTNTLVYSLLAPPTGASIDPTNGVITWTPAEDQGPGTNTITTVVTDNGVPALAATNSFTILVDEVNSSPVLNPIPDATIHAGAAFSVTLSAVDADLPTNDLSYGLVSGPDGANLDAVNGILTWSPSVRDAGSTNVVMFRVSDNGTPVLSHTNGFALAVVDSLAFISIGSASTGLVEVTWSAISGATYRVSYTEDLISGRWRNMPTDVLATGTVASQMDISTTNARVRFYDVQQRQQIGQE